MIANANLIVLKFTVVETSWHRQKLGFVFFSDFV